MVPATPSATSPTRRWWSTSEKEGATERIRLLLNPELATRQRPWDISIELLLEDFIQYLRRQPILDMRLGGLALLTSSIIYKLKVERLFYDERRYSRKTPSDLEEPAEALSVPFRLRAPVSDLDDLVAALESLMKEISKQPSSPLEEGVFQPGLEDRAMEQDTVGQMLGTYSDQLLARLSRKEPTGFGELIRGLTPIEVARVFIVLLFLAHGGKVILVQEEDAEDFGIMGVGEAVAR